MTKRSAQQEIPREQTRNRIFEAAVAEFQETGVGDAKVGKIAARAGVSRAAFYLHFSSKEAILDEFLLRRSEFAGEQIDEMAKRARTVSGFMRRVAELIIEDNARVGKLGREILTRLILDPRPVDWWNAPVLGQVTRFLAQAQAVGELRKDLKPEDMSRTFFSGIFGLFAGPDLTRARLLAFLRTIHCGIVAPKGASAGSREGKGRTSD
jgi:AcrR family transcriptional regulator